MQKHEAEIRNHIRTEQQLRLYIENLETEEHIKNAQIENLNGKVNRLKGENDELRELLELHKRELSIVRTRKFKKLDKTGKGSMPQVKKALTNSQGSIVGSIDKERVREVLEEEQDQWRRRQCFINSRRNGARYRTGKIELNETDETASLTMRKLKINNILDSDHKRDGSQPTNGATDKFSLIFRRMDNTNRKAKHSSKGSLSHTGMVNISATARCHSGRVKPRKPLVSKPKKMPLFDRKEKFDLSKLQKTSMKKSSIASSTKTKRQLKEKLV